MTPRIPLCCSLITILICLFNSLESGRFFSFLFYFTAWRDVILKWFCEKWWMLCKCRKALLLISAGRRGKLPVGTMNSATTCGFSQKQVVVYYHTDGVTRLLGKDSKKNCWKQTIVNSRIPYLLFLNVF